jgi:hypothetical protein
MNLLQVIKSDFNTPWETLKNKSYHYHWLGGLLLTTVLTFLYAKYADFPNIQPYLFSIAVNFLLWAFKEMIWFTAYTFEEKYTWISKLRKYKVFQWGTPDWKDVRFSFYGSIPLTLLLALLLKNKK